MVERRRELLSFLFNRKWPLFIEEVRVGEDLVRTGRISDRNNPQSWPFGLPTPLLLKSFHPDVQFERFEKIWPPFDVTLKSLRLDQNVHA